VQQSRMKDGSRKVTFVTEVAGMEGNTIVMTDIFRFNQTGIGPNGEILGGLEPTGIRPMFIDRLEASGFKLGAEVFSAQIAAAMDQRRQQQQQQPRGRR
jgi:pilus assembly protein CpaF